MTLRLTLDDVRGLAAQGRITLPPDLALREYRGRTRSGRREDLGIAVRSAWEANYGRYLNLLVARGEVRRWAYESKVFLFTGITRGCREYRPDFEVTWVDGRHEWHEVKGWFDSKSKTRLKRMAKYFPAERVVVIAREWFVEAERTGLVGAIPGWERL